MKKYTLTVLSNLKPGDTFYKDDDDLEIVYEVLPVVPCAGMMSVKKGELMLPDMLPKKQAVIFLKHKIIT